MTDVYIFGKKMNSLFVSAFLDLQNPLLSIPSVTLLLLSTLFAKIEK